MISRKGSEQKRQEFLARDQKPGNRGLFEGFTPPANVLVSGNSLWIQVDNLEEDISSTRVRAVMAKVRSATDQGSKKKILEEELVGIVHPVVARYMLEHEDELYEQ